MRTVFGELQREDVIRMRSADLAMRLLMCLSGDSENRNNFINEASEFYGNDWQVLQAYLAAWAFLANRGIIVEKQEPGWFFVSIAGEEEKAKVHKFGLPVLNQQQIYGNRWVVDRELGRGGQGQTYLARDKEESSDELWVVKELREVSNEQARQRFAAETRALAALEHPNILRIVDMDIEADTPWYVSEYLPGRGLDRVRLEETDLRFRLSVFLDVCRGLAAAHVKNITHRDLKPENVLLRSDRGPAILGDFGLCWLAVSADDRLTRQHEDMGSSFCRAPELFDGPLEHVTPSVDIYCLGKLLYWLMVAKGGRAGRLRAEEFDSPPKNLVNIHRDPKYEHINDLLRMMISVESSKRFRDAGEVLRAATETFRLMEAGHQPVNGPPSHCLYCGRGEYQRRQRDQGGTQAILAILQDYRFYQCYNCGHTMIFRNNPLNSRWKLTDHDPPYDP